MAQQIGLRDVVEDFVRWTLMKDLYLRNQFADLPKQIDAMLDDDGRKVLSAIADPGFAARTVDGIVAASGLPAEAVDKWIGKLAPLLEQGTALGDWKIAARKRRSWLVRKILGEGRVG